VSRLVVDPVTRIEGHLRIEAQLDGDTIADAWSSGTAWRGLEKILQGRDPRTAWYFAQRICGVCTTVHALASVRAVEDAVGIEPPPAALAMRDLLATSQLVQDHVVHFYHLHALDWVDVVSALDASPEKTARLAGSLSDYERSSAAHFGDVRERMRTFVAGGSLGPFANGYWGHPAYLLPPELNLLALSHYLDALSFQRDYIRIHALLGGKNPHPQTYLVGGMAKPLDLTSPHALNREELRELGTLLEQGLRFAEQVYLPDALAIASHYPDWFEQGAGPGNFLSFGDLVRPGGGSLFPAGIVRAGGTRVEKVDPGRLAESVAHSWYSYAAGDSAALHPFEGETSADYTGPEPPFEQLDVDGKYSWVKAPRYAGEPMEVGPAARLAVGLAAGDAAIRELAGPALARLKAGPAALSSTMGRTAARALETVLVARHSLTVLRRLEDLAASGDWRIHTGPWDPAHWPEHARGVGFVEAPRGALSHWIEITDGKIANYQAVVPSTWNASPRDQKGLRGPYETALIGTRLADPERPLEILRTLHSFDPCMACAAHVVDADGRALVEVRDA
jgi:Ni,Fe-hydrogenase I large subunit